MANATERLFDSVTSSLSAVKDLDWPNDQQRDPRTLIRLMSRSIPQKMGS